MRLDFLNLKFMTYTILLKIFVSFLIFSHLTPHYFTNATPLSSTNQESTQSNQGSAIQTTEITLKITENLNPQDDSKVSVNATGTYIKAVNYTLAFTANVAEDSGLSSAQRGKGCPECFLQQGIYTRGNGIRNVFSVVVPDFFYKHLDICDTIQPWQFVEKNFPNESIISKGMPSFDSDMNKTFFEYVNAVRHGSEFWPHGGFYEFIHQAHKIYSHMSATQHKKWYAKLLLSDKALDKNSVLSLLLRSCVSSLQTNNSLEQSVCDDFNFSIGENMCPLILEYTSLLNCKDRYIGQVSSHKICERLNQPDLGLIMPPKCNSILSSTLHLNLELENVQNSLFETPETIHPFTIQVESFKYFWMERALQMLTRWSDLHLFCLTDNEEFPTGIHEDLELVPKWKSLEYFYLKNSNNKALPLAVLAKYQEDTTFSKIPNTLNSTARFLFVVRDSRTSFESFIQLLSKPSRVGLYSIHGSSHDGYFSVAVSLGIFNIENIIRDQTRTMSPHSSIHFTIVTNGKFGTGVSLAVLYNLLRSLNPDPESKEITINQVRIFFHFITFSGGYSGDRKLLKYLSRYANMRHIVEKGDVVDYSSCLSSFRCEPSSWEFHRIKNYPVLFEWIQLPGRVEYEYPPYNTTQGASFSKMFDCSARQLCSTRMWLEKTACRSTNQTLRNPECSFFDRIF